MSYYRAALAAARMGNLTAAGRLAGCSVLSGEETDSPERLLDLLRRNAAISSKAEKKLRSAVVRGKYRKALKIKLPKTARSHTVRGLLYGGLGRTRKAEKELLKALMLDAGNDLARKALAGLKARNK